MASNFNNFADNKPIVINSGDQQGSVQMNSSIQNGHRAMSGNLNGPWNHSTQQLQQNDLQPAQNNYGNQGYVVSQMQSSSMNLNQTIQNNPTIRLQSPQRMTSNIVQRPSSNSIHLSQGQPARAMPPNIHTRMVTTSGTPSRTIPPSWPTSSPRQTSTISIQRPSAPSNNSQHTLGEQVK